MRTNKLSFIELETMVKFAVDGTVKSKKLRLIVLGQELHTKNASWLCLVRVKIVSALKESEKKCYLCSKNTKQQNFSRLL